jgi:hypothetical protein
MPLKRWRGDQRPPVEEDEQQVTPHYSTATSGPTDAAMDTLPDCSTLEDGVAMAYRPEDPVCATLSRLRPATGTVHPFALQVTAAHTVAYTLIAMLSLLPSLRCNTRCRIVCMIAEKRIFGFGVGVFIPLYTRIYTRIFEAYISL